MKTKTYIISFVIASVASAVLYAGAAYHNHVADSTPIETFEQGGHTWELVHSSTCKCGK